MFCPRCAGEMQEIPKSGVLIDVCPRCRGVWLDRGELEKLLSRAREYHHEYEQYQDHHYKHTEYGHHSEHYHHHKKHHKKGVLRLLEELFD